MGTKWKQDSSATLVLADADSPLGDAGVQVAELAVADPVDGVFIRYLDEHVDVPVLARSTVVLAATDVGSRVVVVREAGDPQRPIVIGLLRDAPVIAIGSRPPAAEAEIDGRRISLEGAEEVSLRCGEASILLRSDGKIVIRGREIVSRARGTNKVRGASVMIN